MKKFSKKNNLNINLISTYDEVNLGDDLLLYAALAAYEGLYGVNITVNGNELNNVFVKRIAKKSKIHLLKLRFFSQNIYYGGTNFIFNNQVPNLMDRLRALYYIFLSSLFTIKIVANGISPFPKILAVYYRLCKSISVRDFESQKLLMQYGLVATLKEDPVISLFNSKNKIFTDNLRIEDIHGVLILRGSHMKLPDYKAKVCMLLSDTSPNQISHIIFFQQGEFADIANEFDKVKTIIYDGSWNCLQQIVAIIRSSTFVYSMRLHGLLIAKLYGIKATPIVIDDKLERTYLGV